MTVEEFKERAKLVMTQENSNFIKRCFEIRSNAKAKWMYIAHTDTWQLYRIRNYFLLIENDVQYLYEYEPVILKQMEIPFA